MQAQRVTGALSGIFRVAFCLIFGLVLLGILFDRAVYECSTLLLISVTAVALFVLLALFFVLHGKAAAVSEHHFAWTLAVLAVLLFSVQMLFGSHLRFEPTWDLKAIYDGAIHWVETGTFTDFQAPECHTDYFYIFPNNLGGLCYYYGLFKAASCLGLTNYFAVAMVANSLLLVGTMLLSANIARRLWSPAAGLFCAALFLLSPPFWFLAPVFYTDALSMIFPVAVWYCCLRAESANAVGKCLWYFAAGLCGGVGGLLKPTVWIVLIALAIVYCLRRKWKELLIFLCAAVSMVLLTQLLLQTAIYPKYLDSAVAEKRNLPTEYWISIGMSGDGDYRQDYFNLASAPVGQEAKKEALRTVIGQDLKDQGVGGLLKLFGTKAIRAFGDGTYASSDFLDDHPVGENSLRDFLLYQGKSYELYYTLTTGILAAVLLLAVVGVARAKQDPRTLTAPVCLFGLLLFLLVWEVSGRYFVNFIPMIFLTATGGVAELFPHLKRRKRRPPQTR